MAEPSTRSWKAKREERGSRPSATGIIFDIQRYSIHDGPGIRTVVFFKGCPLRCLWCSNPESQHPRPELSHSRQNCVRCLECIQRCPHGAIALEGEEIVFTPGRCDHCGACWENCFREGWQFMGQEVTVPEVLATVTRDRAFYHRSGGGVTLSGGEPLMQPDFCDALLAACQKEGLHTAIETCGYQRWEIIEPILKKVDLVLYDIKEIDPMLHREFTGKANDLILANAAHAARMKPVIIRVPVIPKHNDSKEEIRAISLFAKEIGAKELHLLPYHRLGESKYVRLGRPYLLKDLLPPSPKEMETLGRIAAQVAIPLQIGG